MPAIYPELQQYAQLISRQAKRGNILDALDMIRTSVANVRTRQRQRDEEERARQDQLAREKRQETFWTEQEMTRRQTDEINRMADSAAETQKKKSEEDAAKARLEEHRESINRVNELIAQANMADDEKLELQYLNQANTLADSLPAEVHKAYPKFAGLEQRLTSLKADMRSARREAAKAEKPLSPSDQLAQMKMEAIVKLQQAKIAFDNGEIGLEDLQREYANAALFDPTAFDKIPDWVGFGTGEQQESSVAGKPMTIPQTQEAKSFNNEPILNPQSMDFVNRGMRIGGDTLAVQGQPVDQRDFHIRRIANEMVETGKYENTPRGRSLALQEAEQVVDSVFIKNPKVARPSAIEQILNGEPVQEDFEPAVDVEAIERELRGRYPDLDTLLESEEFRKVLDDEYGFPISEWLSYNQVSVDVGLQ